MAFLTPAEELRGSRGPFRGIRATDDHPGARRRASRRQPRQLLTGVARNSCIAPINCREIELDRNMWCGGVMGVNDSAVLKK